MLSNDVLVVIQPYTFQKIYPINKNADILQIIDMKAQTSDVIPYHIVLPCILSNGRLKTTIGNNCSKGCTGDKLEKIVAMVPTITIPILYNL